MFPEETYKIIMEKLSQLKNVGIDYIIDKSDDTLNPFLIFKYNQDNINKLPPHLWVNVRFDINDTKQVMKASNVEKEIVDLGVVFEKLKYNRSRVWKFDWYTKFN